jgi:ABC-type Fe3+ transport system permease subunit
MSPVTRSAALTALWITALIAAVLVLGAGFTNLSDAALRLSLAIIGLVTALGSLLLFQSPQPVTPLNESRHMAAIRTTTQLQITLR